MNGYLKFETCHSRRTPSSDGQQSPVSPSALHVGFDAHAASDATSVALQQLV